MFLPVTKAREWRIPHAACLTCCETKNRTLKGEPCDWLSPLPSCPNEPSPHIKRHPVSMKGYEEDPLFKKKNSDRCSKRTAKEYQNDQ